MSVSQVDRQTTETDEVQQRSTPTFTAAWDGRRYMPGLAWKDAGGRTKRFASPADVLEAAHRVEDAVDLLGEARTVVRRWRGLADM